MKTALLFSGQGSQYIGMQEIFKNHDKIDNFCVEDIKIIDYIHFESIKMEMRK